MKKIILVIVLLIAFATFGKTRMTTAQLQQLIATHQGNSLLLEDYEFVPFLDPVRDYYVNEVVVNTLAFPVEFYKCSGDIRLVFDRLDQAGRVSFQSCKDFSLVWNASVLPGIYIGDSEFKEVKINACSSAIGYFNAKKTTIQEFSVLESEFSGLPTDRFLFNFYNSEVKNLIVYKSGFNSGSLNLVASQVENFTVVLGKLFRTNFSAVDFNKTFAFKQSSIENQIGLQDISLPANTNFSFQYIKGFKIAILTTFEDSVQYQYAGITKDELSDVYLFNDLQAIYNELYQLYKSRGDLESANAAYVEMKEVQTRYLGYLYEQNPALRTYLSWKLNIFLRFFCDFGTNPVKSIILSIYTIALFAFFYFLFPSESDNLQKSRLLMRIRTMNEYFQSQEKIEEKSHQKYEQEIKQLEEFKAQLTASQAKTPAMFRFFTKPFYNTSLVYYKLSLWFLSKFRFIGNKPWGQLKPMQKFWTGSLLSFGFLLFVIWGFMMRFINAALLSLNSFITLGYGEIEAKGISRYLAVLEGAVGWFLLSIFSVSLISQILQ